MEGSNARVPLPSERAGKEDFAAFFDGVGAIGLEVFEGVVLAAGPDNLH